MRPKTQGKTLNTCRLQRILSWFECDNPDSTLPGCRSDSESDEESDPDSPPKKRTYKGRLQDMVGKVVLMETEDRKRTYWVPTLVVSPNASDLELKHSDHLLLKSFKDSKL